MSSVIIDAARAGRLDTLKELKQSGFEMDVTDSYGSNALHFAAQNGHLDCIKFLIHECGIDIESKGANRKTALQWSLGYNKRNCIDYLVSLGAKLVVTDEVIKWAVVNGELSMILSQNPSHVDRIARVAACKAARDVREKRSDKYEPIMTRLLDMGVPVTDEMFAWAVITNNVKFLERLYERDTLPAPYRDARLTAAGRTLIQIAAKYGSQECLVFLLDKSKVMMDYTNKSSSKHVTCTGTALEYAVRCKHPKCAEILLVAGTNPKTPCDSGDTVLHTAASVGCLVSVGLLIKYDPSLVNIQNIDGDTALHRAAIYKHFEIIDYLISKGADKTIKNNDDMIPLQLLGKFDRQLVNCIALLS